MYGDFSRFLFNPHEHDLGIAQPNGVALRNRTGVLQQQGRVITDADLSEGELIDMAWRAQAGRDVMGPGVCAVPAAESAGFRVETIAVNGSEVRITVRPGRAWVDGLLARLAGPIEHPLAPLQRTASYFGLPFDASLPTPASIGEGVRDVVVLEAWHDVLHGLQYPVQLIEPALGGPDTSERAFLSFQFRLLRLTENEDCTTALTRLRDDPTRKGRLSVSLTPVIAVDGDCPVVGEGGYRGLEHNLYRIEIAQGPEGAPLRFKWCPMNGGLVGRGRFDVTGGTTKVLIDAGRAPILSSGLTEFYLEAVQFDAAQGIWRVTYASVATLNADQELELAAPASFGSIPNTTAPVFFRLWNGLRDVAEFSNAADPQELRDGIQLAFDPGMPGALQPGDYWTFAVRAGEIGNAATLIDHAPPHGIVYHRVALAEVEWHGGGSQPLTAVIEDCRTRFRPLTQQRTCCTYLIGDGLTSFGDFNSLEEAAAQLPAAGGELCLLPGLHRANLQLTGRKRIRIHGCRHRTLVFPRAATRSQPLLHFASCTDIEISDLDLVTFDAVAVLSEASSDVRIHDTRVVARRNSIRVIDGRGIVISDNRLHLLDTIEGRAGVSLAADDVRVENNTLIVLPFVEPGSAEQVAYVQQAWEQAPATAVMQAPPRAFGGIHIRPGCERVAILRNTILGGAGAGVTLGGDFEASEASPPPGGASVQVTVTTKSNFLALVLDARGAAVTGIDVFLEAQSVFTDRSDAEGLVSIKAPPGAYTLSVAPTFRIVRVAEARDEGVLVTAVTIVPQTPPPALRGFLHQIRIEENDISMMGLSGIGFGLRLGASLDAPPLDVPENDPRGAFLAFVDALTQSLAMTPLLRATDPVRDLVIRGNRLHHNLRAPFAPPLLTAAQVVGFGGISLPVVESLIISGNHVHENGGSAINPTCGIFLGYVNDVEITDNMIVGNGAITADYEQNVQAGLRGGIYVRFAGALTTQLSAAAGRKPAIRIHDNRVDQSAGRALTLFAFGPVSVANNHLNSENTGKFRFVDAAVGGAFIVNLGGIHRVLARRALSFIDDSGQFVALAERALPGGETLFNDNFLRVGIPNRSLLSNLLLTFDDLSFAANTSSVYRIDPLFANVMLIADTLRATGSRLREDALCTASLITLAWRANITWLNQADHFVFMVPAFEPQEPDGFKIPNQTLRPGDCKLLAARRQTPTAFFDNAMTAHAGELGGVLGSKAFEGEIPALAMQLSASAVNAINATQVATNQVLLSEASRMRAKHGASHPVATQLQAQADAGAEASRLLAMSGETLLVDPPKPQSGGAVLSGRFVNTRGQGLGDHTVSLLRANGTQLLVVGTTNAVGFFSAVFRDEQAAALAKEGELHIRVTEIGGKEVLRTQEPIRIEPNANVQLTLTVPVRVVPRSVVIDGTVIYGPKVPPGDAEPPKGGTPRTRGRKA